MSPKFPILVALLAVTLALAVPPSSEALIPRPVSTQPNPPPPVEEPEDDDAWTVSVLLGGGALATSFGTALLVVRRTSPKRPRRGRRFHQRRSS